MGTLRHQRNGQCLLPPTGATPPSPVRLLEAQLAAQLATHWAGHLAHALRPSETPIAGGEITVSSPLHW